MSEDSPMYLSRKDDRVYIIDDRGNIFGSNEMGGSLILYGHIEKSLKYGNKISGHYVQGHVDATAKVKNIKIIDKSWVINLDLDDKKLFKYLIEKASVSINGVSLTISKVGSNKFQISVIPHTLKLTNLKNLKVNDVVNVELDIFSKYIKKISV